MTTPGTRLTVDADAAATRRELGPLAWFVLEELAMHAIPDGETGAASSGAGVRDLAVALGISKDTAARAVARLIDAGIVRRETARDSAGRFGCSRYVVHLPAGLARGSVTANDSGSGSSAPGRSTRHRRPSSDKRASQLSLIGADG